MAAMTALSCSSCSRILLSTAAATSSSTLLLSL
eukprot:CAMPEP_0181319282 /NCGR_PEP_ID=MMETSP1101-20121128/17483_1 /TAXON_ID=46948 /ORGANISM="Rhodomonas abbreviata, Strain Caron Lab Isolate" /LENGTH=32 /DNA_ID= /DNA_START= /DNA_END= /DNA_ORIENTATION=